ncbi:MAG: phosphatidylglycerophosphatase A [Methylomonas sp.]|jgi:phosphatidylglycerophosphatase A
MRSYFLKETYGLKQLTAWQILTDPVLCLAFGFGSGLMKYMPGTFGTLAAVPVYLLLMQSYPWVYVAATAGIVVSGIFICERAANKLGSHDFGGIVWDEIAGLLITMCWQPDTWQTMLAGFILFRFFDILKPWPIRQLDRQVGGGLGIMLDDVAAGVFAWIVLRIWIS